MFLSEGRTVAASRLPGKDGTSSHPGGHAPTPRLVGADAEAQEDAAAAGVGGAGVVVAAYGYVWRVFVEEVGCAEGDGGLKVAASAEARGSRRTTSGRLRPVW